MRAICCAVPFLFLPFLVACNSTGSANMTTLSGLKSMHATGRLSGNSNNLIRSQALQDTAMSTGAQAGLAWRATQINQILQDHSKELDQVFNFNRLMLSDHVLPPVLQVSEKNMKLDGIDTIRLSDQLYIIEAQARFVTAPPQWRDYLWLNYKAPEPLPDNMLPKTMEERKVWAQYVAIGWQQGVQQGDLILRDNLARLTRDMKGMILYRKLLTQGMVSQPFVETNKLGITGGGDSLRINDQILNITALPQLQVNPAHWHPVAVPETPTTSETDDE